MSFFKKISDYFTKMEEAGKEYVELKVPKNRYVVSTLSRLSFADISRIKRELGEIRELLNKLETKIALSVESEEKSIDKIDR